MSVGNSREFCSGCQEHILAAKAYLDQCTEAACNSEYYERISYQFMTLHTLAQACNKGILDIYARSVGNFARYLCNKPAGSVSQDEHDLLIEGIQQGLMCEGGKNYTVCPEMNYDKLWEFTQKIKHYRTSESDAKVVRS